LHSGDAPVSIKLPGSEFAAVYEIELSTDDAVNTAVHAQESFLLQARSAVVLRALSSTDG
jgi:hypothetical protein